MFHLSNNIDYSVKNIKINSHGCPKSFRIKKEIIDAKKDLSSIKNELKGKQVFICACETGLGSKGSELTQKMSKTTCSTIIISEHPINAGYKYDNSESLTTYPFLNHLLGNTTNSYKISKNGSPPVIIYDLSIDKNKGFKWSKNGTQSLLYDENYYD